jgi:putative transposase
MARAARIEYPGAFHHVISRGYQRMPIFIDEEDFERMLSDLSAVFYSHSLLIHAMCIMNNHIHLFTETPEANLQQAMQRLFSRYASYYKKKYGHIGKVFERRYKSVLVDSELYALDLVKYIHTNPVGVLVQDPASWNYSSYKYYQDPKSKPVFLETKLILNRFDTDIKVARDKMKEHMSREKSSSCFPGDYICGKSILGSREFLDRIKDHLPTDSCAEFTGLMKIKSEIKLPKIKESVSKMKVEMKTKRDLMLYALKKKTSLTFSEINKILGLNLSKSGLSKRIARMKKQSQQNIEIAEYLIMIDSL